MAAHHFNLYHRYFVFIYIRDVFHAYRMPKKLMRLQQNILCPAWSSLQIKPNTKPIELILPSSAQAWHFTPIWSRVNGYLIRYLVDIGDRVKAGDLLAEIDTPETDQASSSKRKPIW